MAFLEDAENSWQEIAFYNHEYREEHDNIWEAYSFKFDKFIGITKGDYFSKAIELFGKPDERNKESFKYKYQDKIVLEIIFDSYTEKINKIHLLEGKSGFDYIRANTKINDSRINIMGRKEFKVAQVLRNGCKLDSNSNFHCEYESIRIDIIMVDKFANEIKIRWIGVK